MVFQGALALFLSVGTLLAADDINKLREKLAREDDPDDRAKISVQLGEELLKQAQKLYREGAYTDADDVLEEYMNVIRAAFNDLEQSGRDARRKPKGFKDMEIHLRENGRRLQSIARALPFGTRENVEATLKEMATMQQQLLEALMGVDNKEGP